MLHLWTFKTPIFSNIYIYNRMVEYLKTKKGYFYKLKKMVKKKEYRKKNIIKKIKQEKIKQ
jgi:nicotinamide mononucleotide adenylyltransferase